MKRTSTLGIAFIGLFLLNPLLGDIAPKPAKFYTVSRLNYIPVANSSTGQSTITAPSPPSTATQAPTNQLPSSSQKNRQMFMAKRQRISLKKQKKTRI